MGEIVYFSTKSENTHRFVQKLGVDNVRIPINSKNAITAKRPFILVVPTYSDINGRGAVPKQVISFLKDEVNRSFLRGVIAAGNTNFGRTFGVAGNVISKKCEVPFLYRFELMGTDEDVGIVKHGLNKFWNN